MKILANIHTIARKLFVMSKFVLKEILILSVIFLLSAFQSEPSRPSLPEYPDTRFIVFSDPHYYDTSLGMEGEAFGEYLDNDRKLLVESREILDEARKFILSDNADFVILPGDLTKDGTDISHRRFAEMMASIEKNGKAVYVIPGNHDISNPESFSYQGADKVAVKNVDPEEFRSVYMDFGYGEALFADPHSLSYIAEPVDGLWLFAMDACRYEENEKGSHPVTGGRFNASSLQWIENMLNLAIHKNKAVVGFMHHGVLEHYKKQSKFFGEYVVENYKKVSSLFAGKGMKLVFTGHYHAQDITSSYFPDESFIFDIETGSLVTYPCPLRTVEISENIASINSHLIGKTSSYPEGFQSYARDFVWQGIEGIATKTLVGFKLEENEAAMLSGQVADAFVAHYAGDEVSPEKPFKLDGVSMKGRFLIGFKKNLVRNLWHDKHPADNQVKINLSNGEIL